MTAFDQLFATAGWPMLAAQFGEEVTYRPRDGAPRTIVAVVNRNPPTPLGEVIAGRPLLKRYSVRVLNDATQGIRSADLDKGDVIELADTPGGESVAMGFTVLLDDRGGLTKFEIA